MKKVKQTYIIIGARSMKGSKLHVVLNKPLVSDNIEDARKLLFDRYFSPGGDIKITDIALTYHTEVHDGSKNRKRKSD